MAERDSTVAVLLSDDLLFASRITGTARGLGLTVTVLKTSAAVVDWARRSPPRCVLVDLHLPGLDLSALRDALREVCPVMPRLVGYGSHVDAERLRAARLAGCDPAWPRSKFVEELETALPGWLGDSSAARP